MLAMHSGKMYMPMPPSFSLWKPTLIYHVLYINGKCLAAEHWSVNLMCECVCMLSDTGTAPRGSASPERVGIHGLYGNNLQENFCFVCPDDFSSVLEELQNSSTCFKIKFKKINERRLEIQRVTAINLFLPIFHIFDSPMLTYNTITISNKHKFSTCIHWNYH